MSEYVPSEADLRVAWAMFRGNDLDSNPDFEFHNAIARIRRDAVANCPHCRGEQVELFGKFAGAQAHYPIPEETP